MTLKSLVCDCVIFCAKRRKCCFIGLLIGSPVICRTLILIVLCCCYAVYSSSAVLVICFGSVWPARVRQIRFHAKLYTSQLNLALVFLGLFHHNTSCSRCFLFHCCFCDCLWTCFIWFYVNCYAIICTKPVHSLSDIAASVSCASVIMSVVVIMLIFLFDLCFIMYKCVFLWVLLLLFRQHTSLPVVINCKLMGSTLSWNFKTVLKSEILLKF